MERESCSRAGAEALRCVPFTASRSRGRLGGGMCRLRAGDLFPGGQISLDKLLEFFDFRTKALSQARFHLGLKRRVFMAAPGPAIENRGERDREAVKPVASQHRRELKRAARAAIALRSMPHVEQPLSFPRDGAQVDWRGTDKGAK